MSKNQYLNFLFLGIISLIFIITTYQTGLLTSGFRYFIDDHQIFLMKDDLVNQGWLNTLYKWILYDRQEVFRFRPYYQFHIVTLTQFLGINSTLWFLYITILGSLTCFFLFLFGRTLSFSIPIALIFSVSVLLGNQSEIWMRPLIPDSLGMFLLSLTLVILSQTCRTAYPRKITSIIFVLLVILMSLSKESYILFIPTIIALKIYLTSYFQNKPFTVIIQEGRWTIITLTLIFTLEIIYILFFLGTNATGYAGVDESSFQLSSLLLTAFHLLNSGLIGFTLLAIALYWIVAKIKQQQVSTFFQELKPLGVLLFIALIPQTFLYAKSGIVAGFYLFPFIMIACLGLAKVLSLIEQQYHFLTITLVTVLSIILLSRLPSVWTTYTRFAEDSQNMNQLLAQTKICVKKDQPILVVANPKVRFEAVDSLQRVLRTQGYQNLYLATYGLQGADFYSNTLADTEAYWSFLDPNILLKGYHHQTLAKLSDKTSLQGIIIFDGLDNDFKNTQKAWFIPDHYQSQASTVSFASSNLYCKQTHQ